MTRKVYPFVLVELVNDPGNARFLSIYACECGEAVDTLTNIGQFLANGKEFALSSGCGLTDGDKMFPISYRTR